MRTLISLLLAACTSQASPVVDIPIHAYGDLVGATYGETCATLTDAVCGGGDARCADAFAAACCRESACAEGVYVPGADDWYQVWAECLESIEGERVGFACAELMPDQEPLP